MDTSGAASSDEDGAALTPADELHRWASVVGSSVPTPTDLRELAQIFMHAIEQRDRPTLRKGLLRLAQARLDDRAQIHARGDGRAQSTLTAMLETYQPYAELPTDADVSAVTYQERGATHLDPQVEAVLGWFDADGHTWMDDQTFAAVALLGATEDSGSRVALGYDRAEAVRRRLLDARLIEVGDVQHGRLVRTARGRLILQGNFVPPCPDVVIHTARHETPAEEFTRWARQISAAPSPTEMEELSQVFTQAIAVRDRTTMGKGLDRLQSARDHHTVKYGPSDGLARVTLDAMLDVYGPFSDLPTQGEIDAVTHDTGAGRRLDPQVEAVLAWFDESGHTALDPATFSELVEDDTAPGGGPGAASGEPTTTVRGVLLELGLARDHHRDRNGKDREEWVEITGRGQQVLHPLSAPDCPSIVLKAIGQADAPAPQVGSAGEDAPSLLSDAPLADSAGTHHAPEGSTAADVAVDGPRAPQPPAPRPQSVRRADVVE